RLRSSRFSDGQGVAPFPVMLAATAWIAPDFLTVGITENMKPAVRRLAFNAVEIIAFDHDRKGGDVAHDYLRGTEARNLSTSIGRVIILVSEPGTRTSRDGMWRTWKRPNSRKVNGACVAKCVML